MGKKINACSLNSTTSNKEKNAIMKDLMSNSPKIKLLYVTPEMGAQQHFKVFSYYLLRPYTHIFTYITNIYMYMYYFLNVFRKI